MKFDISREWLQSNGIGGFACGTLIGCNTRRYHALLCAATEPPLGRMVLVNKADETLSIQTAFGDRHFDIGCNQYAGAVDPHGYEFLEEFQMSPLPVWTYRVPAGRSGLSGDIRLRKTLWMPGGRNETRLRYELLEAPVGVQLSIHPFVTGRDYHGIHHFNPSFVTQLEVRTEGETLLVKMQPYADCPPLEFEGGEFYGAGAWYYGFEYAVERERGLDFQEDAWCPGAWVWRLEAGQSIEWAMRAELSIEAMGKLPLTYKPTLDDALSRLEDLTQVMKLSPPEMRNAAERLALAADAFLVRRARDAGWTILAGYPWFTDWGRDTMIALPGLCLSTGRIYQAASILLGFSRFVSEGMIPNRFPDAGETPEYNTVDATLWFFHAASQYEKVSGDRKTLESALYPVLKEIIEWHIKGTRYGIKADPQDGCLRAGEAGTQLTWMDAKVGDWVVTPRQGKPVEIQALWFNALKVLEELAIRKGDEATQTLCAEWSARLQANFRKLFWNEAEGCLYDVVGDDGTPDAALRPNQIFAVSLPYSLLPQEDEARVVAAVQRDLLTPFGLRSLSPRDSRYRPVYTGNAWERDGSYHQGTVWGWLIGPFLEAYLKINHHTDAAKTQAHEWLEPLIAHLDTACIGQVSEIFDGDAPHTPRGCFAQAWSVAEVLRLWMAISF